MNKIEGIPDGWELVRVGKILPNDWYIDHVGEPRHHATGLATGNANYAIIRRIPPPLSIPPKVFADGWIFQHESRTMHSVTRPQWNDKWTNYAGTILATSCVPCLQFSQSLSESQRICRVTWEHGSECEQT